MHTVLVTLNVIPDQVDAFIDAVRANATASLRDEPGCIRFDVHRSLADPHRFVLHEVYADEAAFTVAHRAAPHYTAWREAAARCVRPGTHRNAFLVPLHLTDSEGPRG